MISLQETTVRYMQEQCQPELFNLLVECFETLGHFAISQYEDDLINLIACSEDMHSDEVRDTFIARVRQALYDTIEGHLIKVDKEVEPTLKELNELLAFIHRIQDLEDNSIVQYRVYGQGSPKQIVLDLIGVYSQLNPVRAMEIIEKVDGKLIRAMQLLADESDEEITDDSEHLQAWHSFTRFIGKDTPCLGYRLNNIGYFGLRLKEVSALITDPLPVQLGTVNDTNVPQVALDVFSTMMLCKDTYESPVDALSEQSTEFFTDTITLSKVKQSMNKMYIDYTTWQQAHKPGLATQQEIVQ